METSAKMRISISSPPDRNFLVADIFVGNEQIAEVNRERGEFVVEIYPRQSGESWSVDFEELLDSLRAAKQKLFERTV